MCGKTTTLQRAHIIAVADGGTDDASNYTTLCASCNNKQAQRDTRRRRSARRAFEEPGPFDD